MISAATRLSAQPNTTALGVCAAATQARRSMPWLGCCGLPATNGSYPPECFPGGHWIRGGHGGHCTPGRVAKGDDGSAAELAEVLYVVGVQEDHLPAALNAAIPVAQAVDRGVNWSWLRSVCRTRWPSGTCRPSIGEATIWPCRMWFRRSGSRAVGAA